MNQTNAVSVKPAWWDRHLVWLASAMTIVIVAILLSLGAVWRDGVLRASDQLSVEQQSRAAASEISQLIQGFERGVGLFSAAHEAELNQLYDDPENDLLKQNLENELKSYFPSVFAFTLANQAGENLIDDFTGRLNQVCLATLRNFSSSGRQPAAVIHPNPEGYHIDVMVFWSKGIVFVSFKADPFAEILRRWELNGHSLMLINRSRKNLIEVTSQGARDILAGKHFLSSNQIDRVSVSRSVPNTEWELLVLEDTGVLIKARRALWYQSLFAFVVLSVIVLMLAFWLAKMRKSRNQARVQACEAQRVLATMSHEIRTPLTSIAGSLELLDCANSPEESRSLLAGMSHATQQLGSILNGILDLSRLEAGYVDLAEQNINLPEFLLELSLIAKGQVGDKPVAIKVEINNGVPQTIVGDPVKLKQILLNLTANAARFTQQGEIRLTAQSRHIGQEHWLELGVVDTGVGMTAEQQQRVFSPFAQAERDTAEKYGGTGLGLAISRALAHAMQGDLSVASELGLGTLFSLSIPLKSGQEKQGAQEAAANMLPKFDAKALIVDDDATVRAINRRLIEHLGLTVVEAESGRQALECVVQESFDIIFVDCRMPDLDGEETAYRIRERLKENSYKVPAIIALTGNNLDRQTSVEHTDKTSTSNLDGVMQKPAGLHALAQIFNRCLTGESKMNQGNVFAAGSVAESNAALAEILDPKVSRLLAEIFDKDPVQLRQTYQTFADEAQARFNALRDAMDAQDFRVLEETAHSLKGSASAVGAMQVVALSADIMKAAAKKQLDAIQDFLPKLEAALEQANALMLKRSNSPALSLVN